MIRILLSGCNGAMGKVIVANVAERDNAKIVAGIDVNVEQGDGYPVFANPENCDVPSDVIIDFSHPNSLTNILKYAVENNVPAVIATTGLSEKQEGEIKKAGEKVAVFYSGNMSIGISLMTELARKATAVLGNDFDIEIIEKHHNKKIDAPSGTAFMLANNIAEVAPYDVDFVYERESKRERRHKNEIGISSIRGGTIVGEHEILFAGNDEIVSLKHTALSKNIFAVGSINAALFLKDKPAGLYDMKNLVDNS